MFRLLFVLLAIPVLVFAATLFAELVGPTWFTFMGIIALFILILSLTGVIK